MNKTLNLLGDLGDQMYHLTLSKVEIPPLEYYTTYPKIP